MLDCDTKCGRPLSTANILKVSWGVVSLSSWLMRNSSVENNPVFIKEKYSCADVSRLKSTSLLIPKSSSVICSEIYIIIR
jgi:hypothetical protein